MLFIPKCRLFDQFSNLSPKKKKKMLFQSVYSYLDMQKQKANGPLHFVN